MRSVIYEGGADMIDKKGETQGGTCHNDKPGLDSEKV